MHARALAFLITAAALTPCSSALAQRALIAPAAGATAPGDPLQRRATAPGGSAWPLSVAPDDEASPDAAERDRGWSAPGAMRALAERMSLDITQRPTLDGRRVRQVSVGLKLQF
jgi:hypothetical protein